MSVLKSTKIYTDHGLCDVENLTTKYKVFTLSGYQNIRTIDQINKQKLVSVFLNNRKVIETTSDHKFAVLTSIEGEFTLIAAKDLTENDILLFNHQPITGLFDSIEEGYFFGVLNGDGSIYCPAGNAVITFCKDKSGCHSSHKIEAYWKNLEYKVAEDNYPQYNKFNLRISSTEYCRELLPYKTPNSPPVIPEQILTGNSKVRAAYLAGITDSDGHAPEYTLCNSIYYPFIDSVQQVADSMGIITALITKPGSFDYRINKMSKTAYELTILGFSSKKQAIRLINPFMSKQFPDLNYTSSDMGIPKYFAKEQKDNFSKQDYRTLTHGRSKQILHKHLMEIGSNFWSEVIPIGVSFINEENEENEVYNIEVENNIQYFANGILQSN